MDGLELFVWRRLFSTEEPPLIQTLKYINPERKTPSSRQNKVKGSLMGGNLDEIQPPTSKFDRHYCGGVIIQGLLQLVVLVYIQDVDQPVSAR